MASPDMTEVLMLDDVDLAVETPFVESDKAFAVAGYVNGRYANWPAIVQKWSKTGLRLLSLDVQANPSAGAQGLDIEKGDATVGQAPSWTRVTRQAGLATKDLRWMPKLYISAGSAATLIDTMNAAGLRQGVDWLLWSAHYTGTAHICSPASCGYPQADATQYTSTDHGHSLDASLCYAYFFAGYGDPVKDWSVAAPAPAPVKLPPVSSGPVSWQAWPATLTLVQGDVGEPVRVLQAALAGSGIVGVRGIKIDGNFGDQTETAVRNFQHAKGLTEDGEPGAKTRAALVALKDEPASPPAPPKPPVVVPPKPPVTPAPPPPPVVTPSPPVLKDWPAEIEVEVFQLPVAGTLAAEGYAPLDLPAGAYVIVPKAVS